MGMEEVTVRSVVPHPASKEAMHANSAARNLAGGDQRKTILVGMELSIAARLALGSSGVRVSPG
jgi:hypothetical protein